MDACVAEAVKHKRILLFGEMLQATKFPDLGGLDELRCGCHLTGEVPSTGMLPGKFEPALISEEELSARSARVRKVAERDMRSYDDPETDLALWQKTLEEVQKGWLVGSLESEQVPPNAPRTFGLMPLIDDYSDSGVNACVGVAESPMLHTVDIACAALTIWFDTCADLDADCSLVIRTFDLASAYRQVGLSEKGKRFAYLRVYNPLCKGTSFFRSVVLPFGAVRSVHSFLRLARALCWIGVVGCRLVWTSFYDDFITLSRPVLAGSTEKVVTAFFKLLGWIFAEEGEKTQPFDLQCSALGVLFNLEPSRGREGVRDEHRWALQGIL